MEKVAWVVPAEVTSGSSAIKAKFDAVRWFVNARRADVAALAVCAWRGWADRPSFIEYLLHLDEELCLVLDYAHRARTGTTFSIDAHAAMAWITENRPDLRAECVSIAHLTGNSSLEQTAVMRAPNVAILTAEAPMTDCAHLRHPDNVP
jgi:hypothetical protein